MLTGSDMSVINSGLKRKSYSNNSNYSHSGIGPKEHALNIIAMVSNDVTVNNGRQLRLVNRIRLFIWCKGC